MYKIFLVLFFSTVLFAKLVDGVAITVKGSAITLYEIKEEMKLSNLSASAAADALIRKKLEELEIQERNIKVTSSEVYEDIKQTASQNNMSISDFYEAVRNANGLTSTQLKEKIKQKLLSQKLYSAIAYSSVSKPSDAELEEYYELHKDEFAHPSAFDVIIYAADAKERLQEKVDNPMFYSPDIQTNEQHLPYEKISPELASLLERTPLNTFTPIVPNGQGGFMSFYMKHIESTKQAGIEGVKNQIISKIMAEKRERVLGEHFARIKLNAEIKKIRMPK
ncbi:MAG: peptidylprolyl isomerase [Thiovulaceae bacterium]|nr:peptidylprolyl isomerase [Sulfurimonadaceae bacterium]MCW9025899.1 peptidylprolyl isomerase [Sulfurimonadaceae bacterium]